MLADFSLQSSLLGLSAADLARKFEVQERTARRWLTGRAIPPEPVIEQVQESFESFLQSLGSMIELLDDNEEIYAHILDPEQSEYKHMRPLVQAIYLLCSLYQIETEITFKQ